MKHLLLFTFVSIFMLGICFPSQPAQATGAWTISSTTNAMPTGQQFQGDFMGVGSKQILVVDSSNVWKVGRPTTSGVTWTTWMSGVAPTQWVRVGDFNGDLKDDLLLLDQTTGYKVAISNGASFNPPATWLTGYGGGNNVEIGDFNGDGFADVLVIVHASLQWYVMVNNLGTFGNPTPTFSAQIWQNGYGTGSKVLIGNYCGNGYSDVCLQLDSGNTSYYQVYSSTGSSFGYYFQLANAPIGNQTFSGDFSGDGVDDLLIMSYPYGNWYQLTSTRSSWVQSTALSGYGGVSYAQVGDYNGDGKMDLAYAYNNVVGKALSNGSTTYTDNQDTLAANPTGIYPAWINGDDAHDLVATTAANGSYNCLSTTVAPTRVYTSWMSTSNKRNANGTTWGPYWKAWRNLTSTPMYITGMGNYMWVDNDTWVYTDMCAYRYQISTGPNLGSGNEVNGHFISCPTGGTPTQPGWVSFSSGGLPLPVGYAVAGASNNYYDAGRSYCEGLYLFQVTLAKSLVGTAVESERFDRWDAGYTANTYDGGSGKWWGWMNWHAFNPATHADLGPQPKLNNSGHTWYIDGASIFNSWGMAHSGGNVYLYLYLLHGPNETDVDAGYPIAIGPQPVLSWNGSSPFTSPDKITFGTPYQVPNGKYFFIRAKVTGAAQNAGVDTGVYAQVRE